jgi:uncharacterized membrane protein YgdD (TMEM256/DUF423 family)
MSAINALPSQETAGPNHSLRDSMNGSTFWIALGSILAGLAVAAGAFAAHGLDGFFAQKYADTPPRQVAGIDVPAAQKYLADFKTGAEYQMYHALGMIAVGLLMRWQPSRAGTIAGVCFLLGIVIFSGGLYALTLTGMRKLGAIVPIGGVLFIVGWAALACAALARGKPV